MVCGGTTWIARTGHCTSVNSYRPTPILSLDFGLSGCFPGLRGRWVVQRGTTGRLCTGAVGIAFGHVPAGYAWALWQVQDDAQAVQPLGGERGLGSVFADLLEDRENRYGMIDSSVVRAHQQAATARKKGSSERSGVESRRSDDQDHLLADAFGLPLGFVLTGGQTNDCTQVITLLGDRWPEAVIADKGYDTDPSSSIYTNAASPPSSRPDPPAQLRSHPLPPAQPHRTNLRPPQAVPTARHTLRRTQTELPIHRRHRCIARCLKLYVEHPTVLSLKFSHKIVLRRASDRRICARSGAWVFS
jgi:hypothetical protein